MIVHNHLVEVLTCYDSNISSIYELKMDSLCVMFPVFGYLNVYVPKSTMSTVDNFKGISPPSMTRIDIFKFCLNFVNIYPPGII